MWLTEVTDKPSVNRCTVVSNLRLTTVKHQRTVDYVLVKITHRQVSVQPPTSAVNGTLHALPVERRALAVELHAAASVK